MRTRPALLLPALLAALALALTGCSGADAKRAQELLAQSDQALAALESYRFAGRLTVEAEGRQFTFVLRGGGNARRGGESYVTMEADGLPGFPGATVVQQGSRLWIGTGGAWTRAEVPAGQPAGVEQFDLSPYVRDVSVKDDATVDGEPAVKLTGRLDTAGMFGRSSAGSATSRAPPASPSTRSPTRSGTSASSSTSPRSPTFLCGRSSTCR